MRRVAVLPGDGVGPEVLAESLRVFDHLRSRSTPLEYEVLPYSAETYLRDGRAMPEGALDHLARYDGVLLGAFGDPRVPDMAHGREVVMGLRQGWDLFVNLRPVRPLCDDLVPLKGRGADAVDMLLVRENTQGLYAHAGGFHAAGTPDEVAVQTSIDTRRGVERLARYAFALARERRRTSVTLVDKHNALRYSGDLWDRTFRAVAADFPDVEARHQFVDAACARMVQDPAAFDVVVADNLLGDILGDLAAALAGGLGFAPSVNLNPTTGRAVFEPVHGSAPDIAGTGTANPCAALLAAALLLRHLGFAEAAAELESAVAAAVRDGARTRDAGGALTTREMGDAVLARLGR